MKTTSSEIDLFNHEEFGEGYFAMAYHVRDMNQLDRIISKIARWLMGRWSHRISMSSRVVPSISGRRFS